jgi:flagellar protein FlaG
MIQTVAISQQFTADVKKNHEGQEVKVITELGTPREVTKAEMYDIIKTFNKLMTPSTTSLRFQMHEASDKFYVELIDDKTGQVIREIPSKKMLDIYTEMTNFIGLMFDQQI